MSDDYWAISNLVFRYAELLNLGRIDELAELFKYGRVTGDANGTDCRGSEAVAEMYRRSVHFGDKIPDTLLVTSNLQISVENDTASGKAYFAAIHETGKGIETVVAGRYQDEFRKIRSCWWFHHRHMIVDLTGDLSTHLRGSLNQSDESTG